VLDRIVPGRPTSVEREVFPGMVADGSLYAVDDQAYWIDTGTPQEYIQAQLDLLDGLRGLVDPAEAVDTTAAVAPDARVTRSVVGPGAVIGPGARVEDAVLLDRVVVEPGAVVVGSVIGSGTTVGERARVVGCSVVGDGQVVGPGERLDGVRHPEACG
jgi:mannose-1-phosphate guanylyltransferase